MWASYMDISEKLNLSKSTDKIIEGTQTRINMLPIFVKKTSLDMWLVKPKKLTWE